MRISLDRAQRDALHAACMLDLTGMDEIELYVREGDFDEARAITDRVLGTASLLEDLGWDPETTRQEFLLRGDPVRLRSVIARLREQAEDSLRDQADWISGETQGAEARVTEQGTQPWWIEEVQQSVDEDLDTRLVCDRILEMLDRHARVLASSTRR